MPASPERFFLGKLLLERRIRSRDTLSHCVLGRHTAGHRNRGVLQRIAHRIGTGDSRKSASHVKVSLHGKKAVVSFDRELDEAVLKKTIEDAGYTVEEMK